eukprot:2846975-Pleurochrysis_carterae.AAC.1
MHGLTDSHNTKWLGVHASAGAQMHARLDAYALRQSPSHGPLPSFERHLTRRSAFLRVSDRRVLRMRRPAHMRTLSFDALAVLP